MDSEFFNIGSLLFFAQPLEIRRSSWTGWMPDLGRDSGFFDHLEKTLHGIFAIALLRAKSPGFNDYFARRIDAFAGDAQQPFADFVF